MALEELQIKIAIFLNKTDQYSGNTLILRLYIQYV